MLDSKLRIDLSCVAPGVNANPLTEGRQEDAVEPVKNASLERGGPPEHLVAESSWNPGCTQECRQQVALGKAHARPGLEHLAGGTSDHIRINVL